MAAQNIATEASLPITAQKTNWPDERTFYCLNMIDGRAITRT